MDLPNVMSKFLDAGMSLSQVVACVTTNASRVFPHLNDRGTLHVGARADLALLELRHGLFDFVDNYENLRTGGQRLFPRAGRCSAASGCRAPEPGTPSGARGAPPGRDGDVCIGGRTANLKWYENATP